MFRRSDTGVIVGRTVSSLGTGTDSPVSADSSTCSSAKSDQPQVGRDHVAALDQHEVTGHHALGLDDLAPAVTHDACLGSHQRPERGQCGLGLGLLDETGERVDQYHRHDHGRVDVLPERQRHRRRGHQHVDERVVELPQEPDERPCPRALGQLVRPEPLEPACCLLPGEAAPGVGVDEEHDLVDGKGMVVAGRMRHGGRGRRRHRPATVSGVQLLMVRDCLPGDGCRQGTKAFPSVTGAPRRCAGG